MPLFHNHFAAAIDGIVAYKIDDWAPIDRKTLPPLQSVVGGKVSLSTLFRQIK